MGRPRKKTEEQAPTEFNYEDDDAVYRQVMSGTISQEPSVVYHPEPDTTVNIMNVSDVRTAVPAVSTPISLIFLVEGRVRLDQEGAAPIFSDQRRIVNATNVDEAIQKFVNYFTNMSNPTQRYTVVQVAASETIL